jgi:hypothetical protein
MESFRVRFEWSIIYFQFGITWCLQQLSKKYNSPSQFWRVFASKSVAFVSEPLKTRTSCLHIHKHHEKELTVSYICFYLFAVWTHEIQKSFELLFCVLNIEFIPLWIINICCISCWYSFGFISEFCQS